MHRLINHACTLGFYFFITHQVYTRALTSLQISSTFFQIQEKKMSHLSLLLLIFIYILTPSFVFSSPVQDPDLVVHEVHRYVRIRSTLLCYIYTYLIL